MGTTRRATARSRVSPLDAFEKKINPSIMRAVGSSSSVALRGARVPMTRDRSHRHRAAIRRDVTARVHWVLDRDNCGGARSEDDGVLLRGAPDACLAVPIDVNTLVDQNAGALEFEGENLRFECPNDSENELVVQSLDGKKLPRNKKMKLRAGARLKVGSDGEEF